MASLRGKNGVVRQQQTYLTHYPLISRRRVTVHREEERQTLAQFLVVDSMGRKVRHDKIL